MRASRSTLSLTQATMAQREAVGSCSSTCKRVVMAVAPAVLGVAPGSGNGSTVGWEETGGRSARHRVERRRPRSSATASLPAAHRTGTCARNGCYVMLYVMSCR